MLFKLENTIKTQMDPQFDSRPPTSGAGATLGATGGDMFADDTIVTSNDNQALVQQIIELKRKLDDEHQGYKRKLQHYYDGQQRQAQVVQKLQQKVMFDKSKIYFYLNYLFIYLN